MGMMAVLAVGQMAYSASQSSKISDQMQAAQESQKQLQDIQMERQQNTLMAEKQVQQANITAAAAAQGVSGSSMESQAQSSLDTQLNTELAFLDDTAALQTNIADAQSNINQIQGETKLVSSVFDIAGNYV